MMTPNEEPAEGVVAFPPAPARPKNKGGRPPKVRRMGTANASSDAGDARWTVRGVPVGVRERALRAATRRKMTAGDWLIDAILRQEKADREAVSADEPQVSADEAGPSGPPAHPLQAQLDKLHADYVAVVEQNRAFEERLAALEKPLLSRLRAKLGAA